MDDAGSDDEVVLTEEELREVLRRAAEKSCAVVESGDGPATFTLAEAVAAGEEIVGVEESHVMAAVSEVVASRPTEVLESPDRRLTVERAPQRFRIVRLCPSVRLAGRVGGLAAASVYVYLTGSALLGAFGIPSTPFLLFGLAGLALFGLALTERTIIEFDRVAGGTITHVFARRWSWTRRLRGRPESAHPSVGWRSRLYESLGESRLRPGGASLVLRSAGGEACSILRGHDEPTLWWVAQKLHMWVAESNDDSSPSLTPQP